MSDTPAGYYGVLSKQSFEKMSDFVTRELGIKMPSEKLTMLQSRLQRRLRHLNLCDFDAYQEHLFQLPDSDPEWTEFINLVTTNKTDFFREPSHFQYLSAKAVPALLAMKNRPPDLKLWCAGCSTGEEPYTIGMVLSEFASTCSGFDFSMLATDISTRVLDHAKNAVYDEARTEPVPADLKRRYFMRSKDRHHPQMRIVPELREKVRFGRLNFMSKNYGVKEIFDVIFFRNVMIYFDKPTQEAVVNRLSKQLRTGGYLFVGHSESLTGLDIPLKAVDTCVFRKI